MKNSKTNTSELHLEEVETPMHKINSDHLEGLETEPLLLRCWRIFRADYTEGEVSGSELPGAQLSGLADEQVRINPKYIKDPNKYPELDMNCMINRSLNGWDWVGPETLSLEDRIKASIAKRHRKVAFLRAIGDRKMTPFEKIEFLTL